MRIGFIQRDRNIAEPLGIMYLSGVLTAHGQESRLFFASDRDFPRQLKDFAPDLVAYSVVSGSHRQTLEISRRVKRIAGVPAVFGGPHATFFPEIIHEDSVDAVCVGEGEQALLELARGLEQGSDLNQIKNLWLKSDGTIHRNPVRALVQDLDGLPFPDRGLIYRSDPYLRNSKIKRFLSSRGCPFQCTYCFNRAYKRIYKGERILRWRSVENLVQEIAAVKREYPLDLVRFVDDIFILPPLDWLEEFSSTYTREIGLPFVCNLQAKLVTRDKVRLLREAGCISVYMAIEAGNDRLRNDLLERRMTRGEIAEAFEMVHGFGISIAAENILGLPGGTLLTDLETVELDIHCKVDNPIATLFQPYPRTKLGEYAVKAGFFHGDFDRLGESYFERSHLLFPSPREKRQIENLQKFFGLIVTHPFLLPLVRHLIRLPPNPLFGLIYRLWDSYTKSRKIFKIRFTSRDYLAALKRVLRY
ncbi:MAG: radical SAM protein [Thermodesulfobacteriota bacterium]